MNIPAPWMVWELLSSLSTCYRQSGGEWASPPPRRESKPIVGSLLWSKMVLGTRTIPKIPHPQGIFHSNITCRNTCKICCSAIFWIFVICNDAGQSQPHGLKWDGRAWHCGIMRPRDLSSAGIRRIYVNTNKSIEVEMWSITRYIWINFAALGI